MNETAYSFSPAGDGDDNSNYGSFYAPSEPENTRGYADESDSDDANNNEEQDGGGEGNTRQRRRVTVLADDDLDRQSANLAHTRGRSAGTGRPSSSRRRQMYQDQRRASATGNATNTASSGNMASRNSFHRSTSRRGSMNGSMYGPPAAAASPAEEVGGSFYRNSSQRGSMNGSFVGGSSFYGDYGLNRSGGDGGGGGSATARQTSRSAPPPRRLSMSGPPRTSLSGPSPSGGQTYTRTVLTSQRLNAQGETVEAREERFVDVAPSTADLQQRVAQQRAPQQQAQPASHRIQRPSNRAPSAGQQRPVPLQRSLSRTMSMRGPMDDDEDDGEPNTAAAGTDYGYNSSPGDLQEQRRLSRRNSESPFMRSALHSEESRTTATGGSRPVSSQPLSRSANKSDGSQSAPNTSRAAAVQAAAPARPNSGRGGSAAAMPPQQSPGVQGGAPAGAGAGAGAVPFFMPPQMAYATPQQQQQWMMRMAMMRNTQATNGQLGFMSAGAQPGTVPAGGSGANNSPLATSGRPTGTSSSSNNSSTRAVDQSVAAVNGNGSSASTSRRTSTGSGKSTHTTPLKPGPQADPALLQQQQQQMRMQQAQPGMYPGRMMMPGGGWGPAPANQQQQQQMMMMNMRQQQQQQQPQRGQTAPQSTMRRGSMYNQAGMRGYLADAAMMNGGGGGLGRYNSAYSQGPANVGGSSLYGDFAQDEGGSLQRVGSTYSTNSAYSYGL